MPRSSREPVRTLEVTASRSTLGTCASTPDAADPHRASGQGAAGPNPYALVRPHLNTVTVAPITTTIRGLSTEVPVGAANGLEQASVVACDHVTTIPRDALGSQIGLLLDDQERELSAAIQLAFDLD